MAVYRIADLNIEIKNKYKYTDYICKDYACTEENPVIDFSVSATEEDYEKDKAFLTESSEPYLETLSIYRQIARKILEYNGFVMHASVVEMDGKAYAFAAHSGVGKSTHSRLWTEAFEGKARIINGDKPLLRFLDGKLYIYGTPWCGKECYNFNTKAPLKAICFIERAETNSIEKLDKNSAVKKIFDQLLMPETSSQANHLFDMIEILIENTEFYTLRCNMEKEAAIVAYNGMNGKL